MQLKACTNRVIDWIERWLVRAISTGFAVLFVGMLLLLLWRAIVGGDDPGIERRGYLFLALFLGVPTVGWYLATVICKKILYSDTREHE